MIGDTRRATRAGPPAPGGELYTLTLFVSGASSASARAVRNVREFCDTHLAGRHRLEIVDLNQQPTLADTHRVLATPTLIKDDPLPVCMLVGDMSDEQRMLRALDLPAGNPSAMQVNGGSATS